MLREHSKRYPKRAVRENTVAEDLDHIAEHLEQHIDIDPYSREFPGILRSMPSIECSRWIANQMRRDPQLTNSEATTRIIQRHSREAERTAASHYRKRAVHVEHQ